MEILVDDERYARLGPPDQTIGELANEVTQASKAAGQRIVVSICCDGEPVASEQLEATLEAPSGRFQRVELQTQSVAALVRATLDQAILLTEDSDATRQQAADLLAEGRHDQAMQELQKFCDVWKQVQRTLLVSAQALGLSLDTIRADDLGLAEVLDLVKTQLAGLKDAMEKGDLVLVGDILRYEFDEPLAHWVAILKQLRENAQTADG